MMKQEDCRSSVAPVLMQLEATRTMQIEWVTEIKRYGFLDGVALVVLCVDV